MWKIMNMYYIFFLIICSWIDIKTQKIPVILLNFTGIITLGFQIFCNQGNPRLLTGGFLIGIIFIFLSWITKEAIGYADGVMILLLGMYLGFWDTVYLLGFSFLLSSFTGIFVLLKCNWSPKAKIPFIPFLATGYIGVLLK